MKMDELQCLCMPRTLKEISLNCRSGMKAHRAVERSISFSLRELLLLCMLILQIKLDTMYTPTESEVQSWLKQTSIYE